MRCGLLVGVLAMKAASCAGVAATGGGLLRDGQPTRASATTTTALQVMS
jgi:hypothetical protein